MLDKKRETWRSKLESSHLGDPSGTFDIESLSILLNVNSLPAGASNVFPVQLTGTKTIKERRVIGANIFKLYMNEYSHQIKVLSIKRENKINFLNRKQ